MELALTHELALTTRLQLVEGLEKPQDVLVLIDNQTVDRPYVDLPALAARVDWCIEKAQKWPGNGCDM